MKILVITQKYDLNDANLGAFNVWWEKLAEKLDFVYILALEKRSEPPRSNMKVFSMGKERGSSKLVRLIIFFYTLCRTLFKTDVVFVHMIPLYLILAWLPAKLFRNKLVMWYAGVTMNNWVNLAVRLSDKTFTSHEGSLRMKTAKRLVIGHGIDINKFSPALKSDTDETTILSVGRITPSKGHSIIIEAVVDLIREGYNLRLEIIGGVIQRRHEAYLNRLKKMAVEFKVRHLIEFVGPVPYGEMPNHFNHSRILVNAVPHGSLDKVVLEAMASCVIPLTSNSSFTDVFPSEIAPDLVFKEESWEDLKMKLKNIIDRGFYKDEALCRQMREIVVKNYNLDGFIGRILNILYELAR